MEPKGEWYEINGPTKQLRTMPALFKKGLLWESMLGWSPRADFVDAANWRHADGDLYNYNCFGSFWHSNFSKTCYSLGMRFLFLSLFLSFCCWASLFYKPTRQLITFREPCILDGRGLAMRIKQPWGSPCIFWYEQKRGAGSHQISAQYIQVPFFEGFLKSSVLFSFEVLGSKFMDEIRKQRVRSSANLTSLFEAFSCLAFCVWDHLPQKHTRIQLLDSSRMTIGEFRGTNLCKKMHIVPCWSLGLLGWLWCFGLWIPQGPCTDG